MWSDRTKIALGEKMFRDKQSADKIFVVYMFNLLVSKFDGNRTNSL